MRARLASGPPDREEGGASGGLGGLESGAVGPPGSLKRAAIEAARNEERLARRQRIDFGCPFPFKKIPKLVHDGFEKMEDLFGAGKGDEKILHHYNHAKMVLQECLEHPICDLMLMLVLTLASSSVTPTVPVKATGFHEGKKRKDPAIFAATLTTRMLWFYRPERFPHDRDDGLVMSIKDMTPKIGEPPGKASGPES